MEFEYDDAGARTRRDATDGTRWSYYGGGYQREEYITYWGQLGTKHHFQISAGGRAVAELTFDEDAGEGDTDPYTISFSHNDERGSPQVVSDPRYDVVQLMSWDVYGKKRAAQDWSQMISWSNTSDTTRGFTGHDELEDASMIWMASRHYDPKIGRFIQPDTIVPNPKSTQGWARYVYVENDPVNYTDPTGHKRNDLSGQRMMSETPTNCSYAMSCSAGDAAYWYGVGYPGMMRGTDASQAGFDAWITMSGSKRQAAESDRRAEGQAKAEKVKDPARSSADTGNEAAKSENAVAGPVYQPEKGVQEKIDVADAHDHTWDHEENPNAQYEFNTSDAAVAGLSLAPLVGVASLAEWQYLALRIRMYFAPPAAAAGAANGLTHLTSAGGQAGIQASNTLRGANGIFALPSSVLNQGTLMRVLRTGVMPANTIGNVEIPTLALGNFHRVFPIGIYSLWKAGGGVRFAAPGALNIATGSLQTTGSILRPAALIYGPDVLTYSFAALQLHLMGAWDN